MHGAVLGHLFQDIVIPGSRPLKSELNETRAPNTTDDAGKGYERGSRWIDGSESEEYLLMDSAISGADWLNPSISILRFLLLL